MKINRDLQDKAIAKELSSRFKQYRIAASMTRTELAEKSMVSVGTIARFENGSDIGLLNLIKLLKAVDLEEKLDLLIPDPQERPSHYVDNNAPKQRARKRKKNDNDWKWGDEE
ncbi:helix-turn-helix domain-containing protein [Ruminococcus flavefaciens]|uniref:helix-turn-helix domain-containing protein n=1 Tax=Ruminococcus flavefaciens TaxID=1265 RepID=UPI0026F21C8E|nr:helix-turn-helix transcriptional regulator [Ruminococcus flavefaciens]